MTDVIKAFSELGVLVGIIVSGGFATFWTLRWIAINLVQPLGKAAVDYLNSQTESTRKSIELLESLRIVETDIQRAIEDMQQDHDDRDSIFSTVHTNESIAILAKAIERIACHLEVKNIDVLIDEIESTLRKQK